MQVEVFVSYSREDKPIAEEVVGRLRRGGLGVWWDEQITSSASVFSDEIEKAIRAAQCILAIWSPSSRKKKDYILAEIDKALKLGSKAIHLSLDDKEPPFPFNISQCKFATIEDGRIQENDLDKLFIEIKKLIGLRGPNEHLVGSKLGREEWECDSLARETPVPGLDVFLSFRPCGQSGVFLLMRTDTTVGWVDSDIETARERHEPFKGEENSHYDDEGTEFLKVVNDVSFIMDPLRPYGIQIGGLRSVRPSAKPGIIEAEDLSERDLKFISTKSKWMSMTLAEILSTEDSLRRLWEDVEIQTKDWGEDAVKKVCELISKNPNAPPEKQRQMCLFCKDSFIDNRRLSSPTQEEEYGASIIANDFPFGPAFHYIAIVKDSEAPVHSWEKMSYLHTRGLNLILHDYLSQEENRRGAAGLSFGFNSTIRHLILGAKTHSSAGASIPHVHKQAWGMTRMTANLAERLIEVSQAYWNYNIDFQGSYFKALDDSGYVIWKNEHVALYVPYGQCSKHELQAMVLQPKSRLTDLSTDEVKSLSVAEYIALRLFKALGINSFNHVVLSKLYNDNRAPSFRLVEAFITREIDLAVSELSMLFVVDQHPWDSREEIIKEWDTLKKGKRDTLKERVRKEIEVTDPGLFGEPTQTEQRRFQDIG